MIDQVSQVLSGPPSRAPVRIVSNWFLALPLIAGATLLLFYAWTGFRADSQPHGERKERTSGRNFSKQTEVQMFPRASTAAPGWDSERVWSGQDDWEPFVAADRSSSYVYQMTTRFNARLSGIFIRKSDDGGRTWYPDHLIAPITEWQADPQVQVADNGTVFAV